MMKLHGVSDTTAIEGILNSIPDSKREKVLMHKDTAGRNILHDVLKNKDLTENEAVSIMNSSSAMFHYRNGTN